MMLHPEDLAAIKEIVKEAVKEEIAKAGEGKEAPAKKGGK
jgi:hypothetical protein